MLQLQLYTITFFFSLLSTVFASATPPRCRNRCSGGVCRSSGNTTVSALPTTINVVQSSAVAPPSTFKFIQSTVAQDQPATEPLATPSTTPTQAIPTPAKSNPVVQVTPSPATSAAGGTSDADIQAYLTAHNSVRAQHGAVPLTWSDNLASKAQQWANGCVFQHSGGTLGPFGENLAAGTGSSYTISEAVKEWTDEVSQYDPNNPVPSHFTQVVWKATTQVGCAVQTCNGIFAASFGPAQFYVCEYFAQGNVIGSFSQNVQV